MITWTDNFCGGGGSSTGIMAVPGSEVIMAANHWDLAVEVHNRNHPDADHACVDLHQEDPSYFPKTDALWASPECTKWSQANGSKALPAIEEGRVERDGAAVNLGEGRSAAPSHYRSAAERLSVIWPDDPLTVDLLVMAGYDIPAWWPVQDVTL